jgi:hypothetical protein
MENKYIIKKINNFYKIKIPNMLGNLGFYNKYSWKKISLNFVISTGRTGTKFLAKHLNEIEGVLALHEPKPDFLLLANKFIRNEVTISEAKNAIDSNRRYILRNICSGEYKRYVESNNRLYSLIPIINILFNNPKIVHVIRDGRDVVTSGMNRFWYKEKDPFERMEPGWFNNNNYIKLWPKMSRFQKICWYWQKKDSIIQELCKQSNNVITVKFEDIFKTKNHAGYYKILDFFDLRKSKISKPEFKNKVNINYKYSFPEWKNWDKKLISSFNKICGKHMRSLGYY